MDLPEHVDLRHLMGPIKQQGKCSCCWAKVATDLPEAKYKKMTGRDIKLAVQQLVDCCKEKKKECYLYTYKKALIWMNKNGIAEESNYSTYKDAKFDCRKNVKSALRVPCLTPIPDAFEEHNGIVWDFEMHEKKIMQVLADGRVVAATFPGHLSSLSELKADEIYKGAKYAEDLKSNPKHAVCIVGYGTDEKTKTNYWLIRNSWGITWADEGYGKIIRSSSQEYNVNEPLLSRCGYI